MSSLPPPPPPPGVPVPPPGPATAPPAPATPSLGSPDNPRPTVPFQPLPPTAPATSRSRTPLYAALLALVLAAGGAGAFVATRDRGSDSPAIDVAPLTQQITKLVTAVGALPNQASATCPIGDIDDFAQLAPEGTKAVTTARSAERSGMLMQGSGKAIVCGAADATGAHRIAVFAGEPFGNPPERSVIDGSQRTVTVSPLSDFRGGKLATICGPRTDNANDVLCDAIWFRNGFQAGVLLKGGTEVTAALAETWLKAALDDIVAGVQHADPTTVAAPAG